MKKGLSFSLLGVLTTCVMALAGCGGGEKTIYENNFENGNNGAFTSLYGSFTENDNTITLLKDDSNVGPNTYFGSETKNIDWQGKNMLVSIKINIENEKFATNEGFNWAVALNGEDGNFINERYLYFRKYDDGVKVGYTANGSSDEINQEATSNDKAKLLNDGWYEIIFDFHENDENLAKVTIKVMQNGSEVFKETDAILVNYNSETESYEDLKMEDVKGIRYGWFPFMSVPSLEVDDLKVTYVE